MPRCTRKQMIGKTEEIEQDQRDKLYRTLGYLLHQDRCGTATSRVSDSIEPAAILEPPYRIFDKLSTGVSPR